MNYLKKIYSKCTIEITTTHYQQLTTSINFKPTTSNFIQTNPTTTKIIFFSSIYLSSVIPTTTQINTKTTSKMTYITTPTPVVYSNCSIYSNTIGIYNSGQNHPAAIFSLNNDHECCEKCQSYPACSIFIFSSRLQECFIYKKISWANIKFLPSNNDSIGRLV